MMQGWVAFFSFKTLLQMLFLFKNIVKKTQTRLLYNKKGPLVISNNHY
jgi:hypothetical protein